MSYKPCKTHPSKVRYYTRTWSCLAGMEAKGVGVGGAFTHGGVFAPQPLLPWFALDFARSMPKCEGPTPSRRVSKIIALAGRPAVKDFVYRRHQIQACKLI